MLHLFICENERRLTNPELFAKIQPPAIAKSTLHWEANKSDLIELLIALDNLGVITEDGSKVSFSRLVREFANFLNVPVVSDIYNERSRILSRSTKRTVFIDRLKRAGFEND